MSPALGAADVEQPEVGGQAGDAERREVGGERSEQRVELRDAGAVGARELLDAEPAVDVLADREAGVLGGAHAPDDARLHHVADPHRPVRGRPAAHDGIDREVLVRDHELAGRGLRDRRFGELPVGRLRDPGRPRGQADLVVAHAPSSRERSAAAVTASRNAARTPWRSSSRSPAAVVPPGRGDRRAQRRGAVAALDEQPRRAEQRLERQRLGLGARQAREHAGLRHRLGDEEHVRRARTRRGR